MFFAVVVEFAMQCSSCGFSCGSQKAWDRHVKLCTGGGECRKEEVVVEHGARKLRVQHELDAMMEEQFLDDKEKMEADKTRRAQEEADRCQKVLAVLDSKRAELKKHGGKYGCKVQFLHA